MKSRRLGCAVAVLHVPPRGAGAQVSAGMQGRRCALPVNRRHPRTQTTVPKHAADLPLEAKRAAGIPKVGRQ